MNFKGNWFDQYSYLRIRTGTGELGNERTCKDHQYYSIGEIGQNNVKSPGNWRSVVTPNPKENHQQTLV